MGSFANFGSISLSQGIAQLRNGRSRFRHIVVAQLRQNPRLSCRSLLQATKNVAI